MASMQQRTLGRTGRSVSVVGLGTWQLGADWGDVSEADARAVLDASVEAGVTFFDTADVYGDGRSETVIGGFLADHRSDSGSGITVATKMGRRMDQVPENYVLDNFRAWTERSRRNLGVDTLDLVQLHCPPTAVYTHDELYDALDTLVEEGGVAAYGVSVEKVEEALAAIARPHVATVQIIVNAFRLKPLEEVFPRAQQAGVGIICRVPLASGLLSGKYDASTTFAADDHRSFNRDGSAFDVGETFSGVDYETGLVAAKEFGELVRAEAPEGTTSAQAAIAWLWQHEAVSSVIPGARNVDQARSNAAAGRVASLGEAFDAGVHRIYDEHLRAAIHPRW
jgi:aryl-alcohol dehydrogenase-like predicted oxidoreductase